MSLPPVALARPVFSWELPVTVNVRETSTREGQATESQYWLDFCPLGSDAMTVAYRDYKVLTITGNMASLPPFARPAEPLRMLMAAVPRFIVGLDGTFRDVEGLDQMLERMKGKVSAKEFSVAQSVSAIPRAREMFSASMSKDWQEWVGYWLGIDPNGGSRQRIQEPVALGGDAVLDTELTFEPIGDGYAKLSRRTTASPETALLVLRDLVESLGGTTGSALPSATYQFSAEAETAWPAIRPRTVHTALEAHARLEGKTASRIEAHHYSFDWAAGTGHEVSCALK